MVDKYKVLDYIARMLGEEYLIPLLGVWDDPEDIDFNALPNQFVLKCNHNSGLGMCVYLTGREWPYKDVPRKIIAEKYMEDASGDLKDYKFYCFDGVMKFVRINSDRNSDKPTRADYFDRDFNWMDFTWGIAMRRFIPKSLNNLRKWLQLPKNSQKDCRIFGLIYMTATEKSILVS